MDADSDVVNAAAEAAAAALLHLQEQFSVAQGYIAAKNFAAAEGLLRELVFSISPSDVDECTKIREKSVIALGNLYVSHGKIVMLKQLLEEIRPLFTALPKAKTAKIVRTLIDLMANVPGSENLQVQVCRESIQWCTEEKRAFLRQRVQSKLAALLLKTKDYTSCNALLSELLSEVYAPRAFSMPAFTLCLQVRKLDDKPLLVEIHLVESRLYYDLRNFPRSRAALTAARTAAGAIYCPPALQAAIDMQAGIINSQEKDFRTGFSYFVEAFDSFQNFDTPNAVLALKYMLLCKIMSSAAEEVGAIIDGMTSLRLCRCRMISVGQAKAASSLLGLTSRLCELWPLLTRNALLTTSLQHYQSTAHN
jgi:26S proteasome regulatory subunit N6